MRSPVRRATVAGVLGASLLLAACGVTTAGSNATQAPAGTQASASATASAIASATATLQAGTVAVVLDKPHYTASDTINATILNGLDHTIWAADHQTDCTILSVEQQTNSGWDRVGRCMLASVTRFVPISASSRMAVTIAMGQAGNGGVAWSAGTFRVVLTYLNSDTDADGAGTTVLSETFTIS